MWLRKVIPVSQGPEETIPLVDRVTRTITEPKSWFSGCTVLRGVRTRLSLSTRGMRNHRYFSSTISDDYELQVSRKYNQILLKIMGTKLTDYYLDSIWLTVSIKSFQNFIHWGTGSLKWISLNSLISAYTHFQTNVSTSQHTTINLSLNLCWIYMLGSGYFFMHKPDTL